MNRMRKHIFSYFISFIALILLLDCGCNWSNQKLVLYGSSIRAPGGTLVSMVEYGYQNDQLKFVIFQNRHELRDDVEYGFASASFGTNCWKKCVLHVPNDGEIDVLKANPAVYQYMDGKFSRQPLDFSKAQLDSYIKSETGAYTVEKLRDCITIQKAK